MGTRWLRWVTLGWLWWGCCPSWGSWIRCSLARRRGIMRLLWGRSLRSSPSPRYCSSPPHRKSPNNKSRNNDRFQSIYTTRLIFNTYYIDWLIIFISLFRIDYSNIKNQFTNLKCIDDSSLILCDYFNQPVVLSFFYLDSIRFCFDYKLK